MTLAEYRELYDLAVMGAVARSADSSDACLARPAALMLELYRSLSIPEGDKLISALEGINRGSGSILHQARRPVGGAVK